MRPIHALFVAALLPLQLAHAQAQGPKENWDAAPAIFPAGAMMAVVKGDPSKAEMFTIRLDLPQGYRIAPHFHPTDEHLTIVSGAFLVGMGDNIDPKQTLLLAEGDTITARANMHHYAIARARTIVEVRAMGPFQLTYVNVADDPTRKGVASR
jgi:quercetin dioxygenase-like cupin family protein